MAMSPGQQMVDAFRYVRDVHRNCARMLLSCDPYLQDEGYIKCPKGWDCIYGCSGQIDSYDTWLHGAVIQQYSLGPYVSPPVEIFTVGAIPWMAEKADAFEPVCIASRLWANKTTDEIYWIGIAQIYEKSVTADGQVRELDGSFLSDSNRKSTFLNTVNGGCVLSIAVPLVELTRSDEVYKRIIKPLLNHQFWTIQTNTTSTP